jgi:hypothetical protein
MGTKYWNFVDYRRKARVMQTSFHDDLLRNLQELVDEFTTYPRPDQKRWLSEVEELVSLVKDENDYQRT